MQEPSIYTGAMLMDALHDPEVAADVASEHEGLAVMVIGSRTVMVDTTQWNVSQACESVVTHGDGHMTIERVSSSHAVDWPGAGRRAALTEWHKGPDGKRRRDLVTVIGVVLVERDASSRPATLPPRFAVGSDILRDLKDLVLSAQTRVLKDHSGDLATFTVEHSRPQGACRVRVDRCRSKAVGENEEHNLLLDCRRQPIQESDDRLGRVHLIVPVDG